MLTAFALVVLGCGAVAYAGVLGHSIYRMTKAQEELQRLARLHHTNPTGAEHGNVR